MATTFTLLRNGVEEQAQCDLYRDVFTRLFYSTLLGGEFANCHGQGGTEERAIASLKIRIYQLRNAVVKNK